MSAPHMKSVYIKAVWIDKMIEDKYLIKYKEIYKRKIGRDIPDQEVVRQFNKLVMLVKNVYQPIKKEDYEKFQKENKDKGGL